MTKTQRPYKEAFPVGSLVRVAGGEALEKFRRDWSHHNPLQPEQVPFAGSVAVVVEVGFYHGGDTLYRLAGIPGTWHEACLEVAGGDAG